MDHNHLIEEMNGANVYIGDMESCVTTTMTTGTTTTTLHPLLTALRGQIETLKNQTAAHASDIPGLAKEIDAAAAALGGVNEAVELIQAELRDTKQAAADADAAASARMDALELESRQLRAILEGLVAAPVRPEVDPDSPAAVPKCVGAVCLPEVAADGKGGLAMRALGSSLVFETAECDETDLCGLAKDVQALLNKFEPDLP